MRRWIRRTVLVLLMPLPGFLKKPALRLCFGYKIGRKVRIGLVLLDCRTLTIADGVRIGHGTVFLGCGNVAIGEQAAIGPLNLFRGGETLRLGRYCQVLRLNVVNAIPDPDWDTPGDSTFDLGDGAVLTSEHRVDFTDEVRIGRCTVIAGRNSSFWTHVRRHGKPLWIGDYCYVGSESRFAGGARIPDRCIVGMGAVVTKAFAQPGMFLAGVPARTIRALNADDLDLIGYPARKDLPQDLRLDRQALGEVLPSK
jgi:acetyltransferase-like isoleucine patch superfamily enzyme